MIAAMHGQDRETSSEPVGVSLIGADPWFVEALRSRAQQARWFAVGQVLAGVQELNGQCARDGIAIVAVGGKEGFSAVTHLRRAAPWMRPVMRIPTDRADIVRNALQAGAWGCFTPSDSPETVISVLESVAAGRTSFPFVDFATLREDPFEQMTRRELEVLAALARGLTNAQLSTRLGISENTVKHHLKLIYDKLGVANRASAVAQYLNRMRD